MNLSNIHRALVPSGIVAFDTRDPAARAWESWTGPAVQRLPGGSVLRSSTTLRYVGDVTWFEGSLLISSEGVIREDSAPLELLPGATLSRARWGYRFRTPDAVRHSLEDSGFTIEQMYGGWHRQPVGQGVGEIVVVARAR